MNEKNCLAFGAIVCIGLGVFPAQMYADSLKNSHVQKNTIVSIHTISPRDVYSFQIATDDITGADSDGDGLSDALEVAIGTDPLKRDTDDDGFDDKTELLHNYSPLSSNKTPLPFDDAMIGREKGYLLLERIPNGIVSWYVNPNDARLYFMGNFKNLQETLASFQMRFVPLSVKNNTERKKIEVSLSKQRLSLYIDDIALGEMVVSTGNDRGPTPIGTFHVLNKSPRAWSKLANLWMPKWMAFAKGGKYGIHELPEWPNGKKEGANHLGKKVSHGCIRLGVSDAKLLYDWTPIGTEVVIKK